MSVTLSHDTAGDLVLPSPALEAPGEIDVNQTLHLAAGGKRRCYTHGPPKYRLKRTFEALTEDEYADLITWLEDIGFQAGVFDYEQARPGYPGQTITFSDVRIIGPPEVTRKMFNMWDVSLNFEHEEAMALVNGTIS